ncbi:hypothetical protein HOU03_gp218 [Caulobacter phage CcrSC]|uniref:Uncharacterized protein n=1 Tax=Caulobacter phage CcrSC TaxID=2283272 RepID=A0A385EEG8_9CAUD|nr:hypothetical protein HOU03_gp218 [Caulobacter phage CcrSC]AXQ70050.1 hypothetical protein CcrSC_gp468 [Caulobacter phage CcrSC]
MTQDLLALARQRREEMYARIAARMNVDYAVQAPPPEAGDQGHWRRRPGDKTRLSLVREVQKNRCYLCGNPMSPKARRKASASRDHVVAKARGGKNAENILLAHTRCNSERGSRRAYPCELIYLQAVNLVLDARMRRNKPRGHRFAAKLRALMEGS